MIIETDRLILRPFQLKDLSHLHLYRNDPLCARCSLSSMGKHDN